MTTDAIRQRYLKYMQDRQHAIIERANLVLQGDPTTLFVGSGMQPLLPYLLGEVHPAGKRLANSQVCLRTQDIDEVGDLSHTTCFEMLGNWSLGDYFKSQQLTWFFNFLIDEVGLDPRRLYATCFRGASEHSVPRDEQSVAILQKLYQSRGIKAKVVDFKSAKEACEVGMQDGRIFYYDDAENWWSRAGGLQSTPLGDPCGGDCEIFFDFGEQYHDTDRWGKAHPATDSGRFLEIGNSVFMEYRKRKDGFERLKKRNVDFGGGLERLVAASQDRIDVFKIDSLWPLVLILEKESEADYQQRPVGFRIIVDHLRAACWMALDGVIPSNKEQGYVMRRFLRRAMLQALKLQIKPSLTKLLVPTICQIYEKSYPQMSSSQDEITTVLGQEEQTFQQTLRSGLRVFERLSQDGRLSGEDLFKLYDTYGFPKELSIEQAALRKIPIDNQAEKVFLQLMNQQRQRSKTIRAGEFKGGLADDNPLTIQYHTATHLLYRALRLVLGDDVKQRGSNITTKRLRFDFSYKTKVSPEHLQEIEEIVNQKIEEDLPVSWEVMNTEKALSTGVLGAFGDKYGLEVKVYSVGSGEDLYSKEICGGPHVEHTGQLAKGNRRFKIIKEQSCAAGIRRIKAILTAEKIT